MYKTARDIWLGLGDSRLRVRGYRLESLGLRG